MGGCNSRDSTRVPTAKLILLDGTLQEFTYPVKAKYVLQNNPMCFLCNSDDMEFEKVVYAVSGDDELLPGQLYFGLPLGWLNHPLRTEEMAKLAVRSSAALMKTGGRQEKWVSGDEISVKGEKCHQRVLDVGRGSGRRRLAANCIVI